MRAMILKAHPWHLITVVISSSLLLSLLGTQRLPDGSLESSAGRLDSLDSILTASKQVYTIYDGCAVHQMM